MIIIALLLAAIILNVPVAFAAKLPAVCNVFHPKPILKSGPCGHQALLSKCQPLEDGEELVSDTELGMADSMVPGNTPLSCFIPSVIIPNSAPLRC
jgi:hypothetical protein